MRFHVLLCLFAAGASALPSVPSASRVLRLFEKFQRDHGVTYDSAEERHTRLAVFSLNVDTIDAHNALPGRTYVAGVTRFTDLTDLERRERFAMKQPRSPALPELLEQGEVQEGILEPPTAAAASIDWRDFGAVTGVKNQGQCGSCWCVPVGLIAYVRVVCGLTLCAWVRARAAASAVFRDAVRACVVCACVCVCVNENVVRARAPGIVTMCVRVRRSTVCLGARQSSLPSFLSSHNPSIPPHPPPPLNPPSRNLHPSTRTRRVFSATGAMEGADAISRGSNATSLSEEQYMACYGKGTKPPTKVCPTST